MLTENERLRNARKSNRNNRNESLLGTADAKAVTGAYLERTPEKTRQVRVDGTPPTVDQGGLANSRLDFRVSRVRRRERLMAFEAECIRS